MRPIVEGLVKPQGIDLTVTTSGVTELFWRQLHFAEFDVSEMSNSSYIITVANGDTRFVAIPVFPSRRFFHTEITVREGSGISRPEDLRGKRVGVPEYLYNAFLEAKNLVHQQTQELAAVYFELGLLPNRQPGIIESDPYLYGVQPNRDLLEAMTRASNEQGLTPRVVGLDELFHPATMDPAAG